MAKTTVQIRIDEDIKKQAEAIFEELGLTMSDAVNIYIRQCIFHRGIPFEIKLPDDWVFPDEITENKSEDIWDD